MYKSQPVSPSVNKYACLSLHTCACLYVCNMYVWMESCLSVCMCAGVHACMCVYPPVWLPVGVPACMHVLTVCCPSDDARPPARSLIRRTVRTYDGMCVCHPHHPASPPVSMYASQSPSEPASKALWMYVRLSVCLQCCLPVCMYVCASM